MLGIKYAAACRFKHCRLWNTGSPVKPGDDGVNGTAIAYQSKKGG